MLDAHDVAHLNQEWVLTSVAHEGRVAHLLPSAATGTSLVYTNAFECAPAGIVARPPRRRRPVRQVAETAVVVGPAGEEIYTDEFGRVKVQFHWDRDGRHDEHGSCWVRTAQAWAGGEFGFQFVPRIGMEVLVGFLGGDADDPVVLSCLHNRVRMPHHPLPDAKTRSGIRTQSTPGGDPARCNELAFEDAAGQEVLYLRAQKDFNTLVLNDQSTSVGANRSAVVKAHERLDVGGTMSTAVARDQDTAVGRNQSVRVDGHHEAHVARTSTVTVGASLSQDVGGAMELTVGKDLLAVVAGDSTLHVSGSRFVFVDGKGGESGQPGGHSLNVTGACLIQATGAVNILAAEGIHLVCGGSKVEITPDVVRIVSSKVELVADDELRAAGSDAALVLDGKLRAVGQEALVQGSGAELKLTGNAELKGGAVKLATGGGGSGSGASQTQPEEEPESRTLAISVRTALHEQGAATGELLVMDGEGKVVRRVPSSAGQDAQGTIVFEFDPAELPDPVQMVWHDQDQYLHVFGPCSPVRLHEMVTRDRVAAARPMVAQARSVRPAETTPRDGEAR